ncbi:MAG: hypothetical protein AAGI38_15730 [Bacteroidota bacterium]
MMIDLYMIKDYSAKAPQMVKNTKGIPGYSKAFADELLFPYLHPNPSLDTCSCEQDYVNFSPDQLASQDAMARIASLPYMMTSKNEVAVPFDIHCNPLFQTTLTLTTSVL